MDRSAFGLFRFEGKDNEKDDKEEVAPMKIENKRDKSRRGWSMSKGSYHVRTGKPNMRRKVICLGCQGNNDI